MKSLFVITLIALLMTAVTTLACQQYELQFFGKATHINRHSFNQNIKQICTYEINLTTANPSSVCPLSESEVSKIRFNDVDCSLTEGSDISGVIVRQGRTFWVE